VNDEQSGIEPRPHITGSVDQLIAPWLEGRLSPADADRLMAWRAESARNDQYFEELVSLLRAAQGSAEEAKSVKPPRGMARRLIGRAGEDWATQVRRRRWSRWLGMGAIAAAAIAVVGVRRLPRSGSPEFVFGAGEFVTGRAETVTAKLGDGSVVRLGPNSVLRVIAGRTGRDVFLNGRAFFAVARIPDRPFRVLTRAGVARVMGTRFEAKVDGEDLRVVVLEGRVHLVGDDASRDVAAGQMSVVTRGAVAAPVAVDDVRPMLDWLGRFIVFQSTPLRDVAVELERQYGIRVRVEDAELARETVTGWYADRRFEEVFAVVCGVLRAECAVRDGIATIRRPTQPGGNAVVGGSRR